MFSVAAFGQMLSAMYKKRVGKYPSRFLGDIIFTKPKDLTSEENEIHCLYIGSIWVWIISVFLIFVVETLIK